MQRYVDFQCSCLELKSLIGWRYDLLQLSMRLVGFCNGRDGGGGQSRPGLPWELRPEKAIAYVHNISQANQPRCSIRDVEPLSSAPPELVFSVA